MRPSSLQRLRPCFRLLRKQVSHCSRLEACSYSTTTNDLERINPADFERERIRNFCIIAHVDHGKSTLADRLLELTGTIVQSSSNKQVLDSLRVERERGITVKAQTVSMVYSYEGKKYLLNLIDTPGHVDFSYEVSRSLAACQGALLVVDASQGVQAQTVANFYQAFAANLSIVPVLNKVDLPHANVERVTQQLKTLFEFEPSSVFQVSAKTGLNVPNLLPEVIARVPSPPGKLDSPFRALLFDSWFDHYKGVVCLIAVVDGVIRKGDIISSVHSGKSYEIADLGLMRTVMYPTSGLYAGQVGYVVTGMRSVKEARVGDTFHSSKTTVTALPGFKPCKPMVFAGLFPTDPDDFSRLQEALDRLTLNDSSVAVQKETSLALGQGWRLGFLGMLHMEVFQQRLEQEFGATPLLTSPTVPYKVIDAQGERVIRNPSEFPENAFNSRYLEPMILASLICPETCLGEIIKLCESRRGKQMSMVFIDESRVMLKYKLPLSEVVSDFHDRLKSVSSGYASFDYDEADYEEAPLVKLSILINSKPVDALCSVVHKENAYSFGKRLVEKLQEIIPRQLFEVAIQAAVGNKVIARETVTAIRKNVTAKCYGGDISRKMKLLKAQKEGKKRMKKIGNVELPNEAFITVMKRDGSA